VFYFVLLVLERFVFRDALDRFPRWIRHVFTLLLVVIGWVIFYYTDFAAMGSHLLAMIGISNVNGLRVTALWDANLLTVWKRYTVLPLLMAFLCLPVKDWLSTRFQRTKRLAFWGELLGALALSAMFVLSLIFLIGESYNPFIYFRF